MAREVLLQRSPQPTQRPSMAHDRSTRLPCILYADQSYPLPTKLYAPRKFLITIVCF